MSLLRTPFTRSPFAGASLARLAAAFAVAGLLAHAGTAAAQDCSGAGVWINEFDYDDNSAGGVQDSDEFVEIAAPAGTDIGGYQVLSIEGNPSLLFCDTGLGGVQEGEAYFVGTIPSPTILPDTTGTGVGLYVVCFTNTSGDIGASCDLTVTGVASDSNLKNGNLTNLFPNNCPDGALLLDAGGGLADAVSWEGQVPNEGTYGHFFHAPNPSYQVGRDTGYDELASFYKTTGAGRATAQSEWTLGGDFSATPGAINPGQTLSCDSGPECGNGDLESGEDCDDGNTADGDCCSSTCSFESPGSVCDDGDACSDVDTCDGAGSCDAGAPVVCDDGAFCNGAETCNPAVGCEPGTPPVVDDGVGCTDDSCDEVNDVVVNAPNDASCADGAFCNGAETCDAFSDCLSGTPPIVDDGVACSEDSCDEVNDVVVNTPNDGLCADDGDECTVESCDEFAGCLSTPIPDCVPAEVPMLPGWGILGFVLSLLTVGGLTLSRRRD